ncbi:n-acetylglutamate synthase [Hydrogenovibrio crunogenus]|uniref:N-acetylglutamate synthase n=1 Tax=Hydrogenovibrio crunogenus TaxID=39765 RepID=A0A4P7P239_9GAMM|nr:hypothetical protein [Hydrogenovibrio crunogenus]QBZ83352.1 n-acetylglutamate synthase [Hydrogenovibrio crunogenus]
MENVFNLDKRRFKALANASGLSNSETIFSYRQNGNLITGEYQGGEIEFGNIIGKYIPPQTIELCFQCKTKDHEILSGKSKGTIQKNSSGKLNISFNWQWLSGAEGSGESYYEEI